MNAVFYSIGKGPRLKVNKPTRPHASSAARRRAEQAIRDRTKIRMDILQRKATRERGWSAHLLWVARLVRGIEKRDLAQLDQS